MNAELMLKILCYAGIALMLVLLIRSYIRTGKTEEGREKLSRQRKHMVYNGIVGFVANFLDTLGIGSYAITSSAYKLRGSVDDADIPGTMNGGAGIPVCIEALFFLGFVEVDALTLVSMIFAQVIGAFVGASFVTRWDKTKIQRAMGIGLLVLGAIMVAKQLGVGPFGTTGEAMGLGGIKLVISVIACFFFGVIMNIGIGAYAPTMALVAVMGMSVGAAFPIMMGGCALLTAFGNGPKFVLSDKIDITATLGFALMGSLGVVVAATLVKSLPINVLIWVVIAVVIYTAVTFLRDAAKAGKANQ